MNIASFCRPTAHRANVNGDGNVGLEKFHTQRAPCDREETYLSVSNLHYLEHTPTDRSLTQ